MRLRETRTPFCEGDTKMQRKRFEHSSSLRKLFFAGVTDMMLQSSCQAMKAMKAMKATQDAAFAGSRFVLCAYDQQNLLCCLVPAKADIMLLLAPHRTCCSQLALLVFGALGLQAMKKAADAEEAPAMKSMKAMKAW